MASFEPKAKIDVFIATNTLNILDRCLNQRARRYLYMLFVRLGSFTLCLQLFVFCQSLAADSNEPEPVPIDTVITLQRGGCEKRCAVYKITLFADGTLIYYGQYYVHKEGLVLDKVNVSVLRELIDAFRAIDYFHLKSDYGYSNQEGCDSMVSDAPVAITSIVTGGNSKGIIHDHRCVGPVPDQLTQLENKIDKVTNSVRWIK